MKDDQWVRFREWYYGHEIRFEASFTDLSQFRLTRESGTVADSNTPLNLVRRGLKNNELEVF